MKLQPAHKKILEYLQVYGSANTFKLSRDLEIERGELISLVEELTNEGLTKFRAGTVIKEDKPAADQKIITAEEKKPVSEPALTLKTPKQSRSLKDSHSELEKVKEKIRRLEDNWLKKEEELKKDIEDLQTQRDRTAQKLSKEKALLCQIRKEKRELEKSLAIWESSLNQREESVQKREKSISAATEEERLKRLKERRIKPKAVPKETQKVKKAQEKKQKKTRGYKIRKKEPKIEKIAVSKTETEKPKAMPEELWQPATRISEEKIGDKFHDLIEQEISLLKQRRIEEARNIHLQIKDMISEVTDPNQRKMVIKDWNRIKEFY